MPDKRVDDLWASLADRDESDREQVMKERYIEIAALPEDERQNRLRSMAQAEYSLDKKKLVRLTSSRIRVWLSMHRATAQKVARSYDAAMMRRVSGEQAAINTLSREERERYRRLLPDRVSKAQEQAEAREKPKEEEDSIWDILHHLFIWWVVG